ncbi:dihydropteroate synthase [Bacteroidia bacterium]|nr:dihydropteroate synthase [Bacteroidia bacterium]GHU54222.1 dihydropteroate synthase [Bacteroidia bacterium]
MGILNITPDSFYAGSRKQTEVAIHSRIEAILSEGAGIIDIGGYSSRPGAAEVSPLEERQRLALALKIIQADYPEAIVSIDTFRADVARFAVEEYGADIINDIAGGELDTDMFRTIVSLKVPYILMHMRGTPQAMQQLTAYDNMIVEMRKYFADKIYELESLGVNDIILDPGFGFSKTLDQNYELMARLKEFAIFNLPLLVGISRKSMIYKLLDSTPGDSLNGTSVLNTLALLNGGDILRVHDVKAAVEAVRIVGKYQSFQSTNINEAICGCTSE